MYFLDEVGIGCMVSLVSFVHSSSTSHDHTSEDVNECFWYLQYYVQVKKNYIPSSSPSSSAA